jgi:hypothetical protein
MVRRLFDECDKNRDGLLSIKEFNVYVLDMEAPSRLSIARGLTPSQTTRGEKGGRGSGGEDRDSFDGRKSQSKRLDGPLKEQEDKLNLSDDEEDEVFRKHRVLTDHELVRKVQFSCEILCACFD